jgi:hypothetical protein
VKGFTLLLILLLISPNLVDSQLAKTTEAPGDGLILEPPQRIGNKLVVKSPLSYAIEDAIEPDVAFQDKRSDTPSCAKECESVFFIDNPKGAVLSVEYYRDDLTFKEPYGEAIKDSRFDYWDEKAGEYQPYKNQSYTGYVRLSASKAVNEDVAYLPILDYGYALVRAESLALWLKGQLPVTATMQALYPMNASGIDGSTYSHNYTSGTGSTVIAGVVGDAIQSNGNNGAFTRSGNFTARHTDGFAFGAWIYPRKAWPSIDAAGWSIIGKSSTADNTDSDFILWSYSDGAHNNVVSCAVYNASNNALCGVAVVDKSLAMNAWTHVVCVYNKTHINTYFNGTNVIATACGANFVPRQTTNRINLFSSFGGLGNLNGSMDEFFYENVSYSASKVMDTFMAGITEVDITSPANNTAQNTTMNVSAVIGFGDQTLASNITYTNMTGGVHVARTSAGVEANTTWFYLTKLNATHYSILDFSTKPVLNGANVSVTAWGGNGLVTSATQTNTFNITASSSYSVVFDRQNPADITAANGYGANVNISYNHSMSGGVNTSAATFYYWVNGSGCEFWGNGTCIAVENRSAAPIWNGNTSYYGLIDQSLYPSYYSYPNETRLEAAAKTAQSFGANDRIRYLVRNVTVDQYMIFEAFFNCSAAGLGGSIWTYNSANVSAQCASIPGGLAYNHTHGTTSAHIVITLPSNESAQTLCGVAATSDMRMEFRSQVGAACTLYTAALQTSPTAVEFSGNGGVSYAAQTYTPDSHLHHIDPSEGVCMFTRSQALDGTKVNSTVRCDIYQFGGQNPSQAVIDWPLAGSITIGTYVRANWTACSSPTGAAIANYTLRQYDVNSVLLQTLYEGTALSFLWNTNAEGTGNFQLATYCTDAAGLQSKESFGNTFSLLAAGTGSVNVTVIVNNANFSAYSPGDSDSIFRQTVDYGECILQYAYIAPQLGQLAPCGTCNVSVLLFSGDGRKVGGGAAKMLRPGLFCYPARATELVQGLGYRASWNITGPYGTAWVDSRVWITDTPGQLRDDSGAETLAGEGSSDRSALNTLVCSVSLMKFFPSICGQDSMGSAIGANEICPTDPSTGYPFIDENAPGGLFCIVEYFFKAVYDMFAYVGGIVGALIGGALGGLVMLLTDPAGFVKVFILGWLWSIAWVIIQANVLVAALIFIFFIGIAIARGANDPLEIAMNIAGNCIALIFGIITLTLTLAQVFAVAVRTAMSVLDWLRRAPPGASTV